MAGRLKSEQPTFTMRVKPNALVPADAYGEERLDTYRHESLVEVRMNQEKSPKLLKKYWAILALVIRDCKTPWKRTDEANRALKRAFGIMRTGHLTDGREIEEVGSLTQLEGPDFELFFEGAMALLYRITGVDPDTLWKESAGPKIEAEYEDQETPATTTPSNVAGEAPSGLPSGSADVGDGSHPPADSPRPPAVAASSSPPPRGDDGDSDAANGPTPPAAGTAPLSSVNQQRAERGLPAVPDGKRGTFLDGPSAKGDRHKPPPADEDRRPADERAAVNSAEPMNTRELKQAAIKQVLDLALDEALTKQERTEELAKSRGIWIAQMPGHPEFIKTVFDTAGKVMRGELPRPAATKYLFSLKDG